MFRRKKVLSKKKVDLKRPKTQREKIHICALGKRDRFFLNLIQKKVNACF